MEAYTQLVQASDDKERALAPLHGAYRRFVVAPLLLTVEAVAAICLVVDLAVVVLEVVCRHYFGASLSWSEDLARILMMALSFFGAAAALARGDNIGITFFIERLSPGALRVVEASGAVAVGVVSIAFGYNAFLLASATAGQTSGSGLPLNAFFYPGAVAGFCMTVFSVDQVLKHRLEDLLRGVLGFALAGSAVFAVSALLPGFMPSPAYWILIVFAISLAAGIPIAFVLALAALAFFWADGALPQVLFAQAVFRGIDNFILLAIPFFLLVGYLMEANGMSERLVGLLLRLVGRMRGGLNVAMVLGMVIFSGISGSKTADVAAVGSVLIPAARRAKQNPGSAVALLAASAVMAETIPPSIVLIVLGFVANVSIGGLFAAGIGPAALMAITLITYCIMFGEKAAPPEADDPLHRLSIVEMLGGAAASFGLIVMVFVGYKFGYATATEISAFAALYAFFVGAIAFREFTVKSALLTLVKSASKSGLILFIVATAQALSYVLTLQQIPHAMGEAMAVLSQSQGTWAFMLLSIIILILMGAVLEGAAALIIFGPILMPAAERLGIDPLHYGVVLIISMGIGVFGPPMGVGLYTACFVGNVSLKETTRPILGYLGLLFLCLLVIAFVPWVSLALPRALQP